MDTVDDIKDRFESWFTSKNIKIIKDERKKEQILKINKEMATLRKENIKYLKYEEIAFNRAEELVKKSIEFKKIYNKTNNKQRKKALAGKAIRYHDEANNEYILSEKYGKQASSFNKRINNLRTSQLNYDNIISIKNTSETINKNKLNITKATKIIDKAIYIKEDDKEINTELKELLKEMDEVDKSDSIDEDDDDHKTTIHDIDDIFINDELKKPIIINDISIVNFPEVPDDNNITNQIYYNDENENEIMKEGL